VREPTGFPHKSIVVYYGIWGLSRGNVPNRNNQGVCLENVLGVLSVVKNPLPRQ
jgi:hypothetical protein